MTVTKAPHPHLTPARQAVKNTPKRVPSVMVRSPLEAGSPSLDFPLVDTPQPTPEDPGATPTSHSSETAPHPRGTRTHIQQVTQSTPHTALRPTSLLITPQGSVFMPLPEVATGPSSVDLGALLDDSAQKKLLGQKATPPPSPLLSELLKKGSLLTTSPRLVGEGDVAHMTGVHGSDLQLAGSTMSVSQVATGAPTLSRLLEAGPAQFPSPLGSLAAAEPSNTPPTAAAPPAQDTPASLGADSRMVSVGSPSADGKAGELGEEDLVTVSYMGDELDLETVGDIIAIIEEKAALSLCEEAADSHALSGPWETGPFKPPESGPTAPPGPTSAHCGLDVKPELMEVKGVADGSAPLMPGPVPQDGAAAHPHPALTPSSSVTLDHTHAPGKRPEPDSQGGAGRDERRREGSPASSHISIKCEAEEWTRGDTPCGGAVKEEDGGSDGEDCSMSGMKGCGEGDGGEECGGDGEGPEAYLSEADLEPPASESEDGYSLHTASSLQLHNTADSIPSSPASSQLMGAPGGAAVPSKLT
ncbi:hypothetical protein JZ751_004533 [Albula glossodonta]|uniref:Uncharacterized protein n=1 Tax=Albula glossodonta TaxID=121402 RepID=A0A8T2NCL5_9TELE|nr:hypothetical protein JZ751_004533 [Albula glossodonta]